LNPRSKFLDKELEKLKEQLLNSAQSFQYLLSEVVEPVGNPNSSNYRLPQPHIIGTEKHIELRRKIYKLATNFYESHTEFIITAERKLA
jgi:hypothetical protein